MKLLLSQFQLRCVYSQIFSDEKPQSKAIEQDSNFVSLTLGTSAGARASEEMQVKGRAFGKLLLQRTLSSVEGHKPPSLSSL